MQRLTIKSLLVLLTAITLAGCSALVCMLLLSASKAENAFQHIVGVGEAISSHLQEMYSQGLQTEQGTRNVLLNPTDKTARDNYNAADEKFRKALSTVKQMATGQILEGLQPLEKMWKEADTMKVEVMVLASEGRLPEATTLLTTKETKLWREIKSTIQKVMELQAQRSRQVYAEYKADVRRMHILALFCGGLVLALVVLASLYTARRILLPLAAIRKFGKLQSEGDFTVTLEGEFTGELRDVADALVAMSHKVQDSLGFSQGVLSGLVTPFLVVDEQSRLLMTNQGLMSLMEVEGQPEEHYGNNVAQFFYGDAMRKTVVGTAMAEQRTMIQEVDVPSRKGNMRNLIIGASPLINHITGKKLGAVLCLVDQSKIKEQQRNLEEQKSQLVGVGNSINDLAQRVASATEELSASADEQARGANRQRRQTESVSTAMEEMTATVLEVAQNASQSSEAASTASKAAGDGVSLVQESVKGINLVADSSRKLAQVLEQLDSQAGEIDRIINVINDIADQTNLLALNAAIEAARAGDAGRGFAVVADEVRKLAEKTMTATKEVEKSIHEIQERSQNAVATMRETERQVEASTDLSSRTGQALEEIMHRIEDVNSRVTQIATAAEEQSAAAEEINRNIEDIAGIAKEAEEGAGQAASATRDLAELSQHLLRMSMSFTDSKSDASKLRASQGQMKGILPKLMLEFVKIKFGEGMHGKVSTELGNPVFLPAQSYPDQVLQQMADVVAQESGKDVRSVFVELGKYSIGQFHKMYRSYFKAANLRDFYLTMNQTHADLTKALPGIVPPRFSYEDRGNKLTMIYKSRRGYHYYFEGILRGAAEFYKAPVDITVQILDPETARAEINFR